MISSNDEILMRKMASMESRINNGARAEIPGGGRLTIPVACANVITGATNAAPIVITSASHGMSDGERVYISGVTGNTAANGYWNITYIGVNSFSLNGSRGNATYSAGGTIQRLFPVIPSTITGATAATSIFLTPYMGQCPDMMLSLAGVKAGVHDVFVGLSGLVLEAWTSVTARNIELMHYRGQYVLASDINKRYRGTIYLAADGTITRSEQKRPLWNYYGRIMQYARASDAASHAYATGAWREWNNATTSRLEYVIGVSEDSTAVMLKASMAAGCRITIAQDSIGAAYTSYVAGTGDIAYPRYIPSAIGYHWLACAEYGAGGGALGRLDLSFGMPM